MLTVRKRVSLMSLPCLIQKLLLRFRPMDVPMKMQEHPKRNKKERLELECQGSQSSLDPLSRKLLDLNRFMHHYSVITLVQIWRGCCLLGRMDEAEIRVAIDSCCADQYFFDQRIHYV